MGDARWPTIRSWPTARLALGVVVGAVLLLPAAAGLGTAQPAGATSLPRCPLGALASAKGTVDIDFWESMQQANATTLQRLTTAFNAAQKKVHVTLVDLDSYTATWQKYQAGLSNGQLPALAQLTQTDLQGAIDTRSFLPAQSCINATHYATRDFVARALSYWRVDGVQEALPFAVSGPVVYYNKQLFRAAGLSPNAPPTTLPVYLADATTLKAHGTPSALVLDSWHLEMWLATADQLFVDHANGRAGRATAAVFNTAVGRRIWTELDTLVRSGAAATSPSSGPTAFNNLLGMGTGKYAMTIDSSADLGTITGLLASHPNVTLGVGPFPRLSASRPGGVEPGGSAVYVSNRVPAAQQAAAWQFETYLDSPASQATWAAGTGYLPLRRSATASATIQNLWRTYPGFEVAYRQLVNGPTTAATSGAVIGPYADVRNAIADAEQSMYQQGVRPATALATAARQVNAILATYNQRLGTT